MKIAIEATATCRQERTGISRYTHNIIQSLLEIAAENGEDSIQVGFRLSRWPRWHLCFQSPDAKPFWIHDPFLPLFPKAELVHGTDMRVPYWRRASRVATIHDLGVQLFPEFSPPRFREMQVDMCKRLAATCHKIITDSEATRRDFLERYDFPSEDVVTIPLGVESAYRPLNPEEMQSTLSSYGLPNRYLLYVGEISLRKNIKNLLAAYAASPCGRDFILVMVGPRSYGANELLSEIPSLGIENRVRLLGYVPDMDLPAIYAGAAAFVFPTYYEGFGLPVLEAMACGVPTVSSDRGAVPEITGDHAVLVEPDDVESIAEGISQALDMTDADRAAARNHVAKFTWEASARQTRAVYTDAWEKFHEKG